MSRCVRTLLLLEQLLEPGPVRLVVITFPLPQDLLGGMSEVADSARDWADKEFAERTRPATTRAVRPMSSLSIMTDSSSLPCGPVEGPPALDGSIPVQRPLGQCQRQLTCSGFRQNVHPTHTTLKPTQFPLRRPSLHVFSSRTLDVSSLICILHYTTNAVLRSDRIELLKNP